MTKNNRLALYDATGIYFTPAEFKVLNLLGLGWSNLEIAKFLLVSIHTVKVQKYSISEKLSISNRAKICAWFHTVAVKTFTEAL